jgi:DNA-nicking Smr family endonuclease
MAKRAKAKNAAARPKAEQVEPFFRPFARLQLGGPGPPQTPRSNAQGHSADFTRPEPPSPSKVEEGRRPAPAPARVSPPPPPREEPAPVDPQTFALYMSGVRALPGDGGQRIPRTSSKLERAAAGDPAAADLDTAARDQMRSLVAEGLRFETVDDGEHIEGRRLDLDPRDLRRLRRGQYAVDGRLDLHGLGADEARHAVEAFVKKRSQDGDRVVLVVHGKGNHSPRGQAVLRGEIAAWLSQGRSARHVAAFATAPDDHGGTGALLVLLAR